MANNKITTTELDFDGIKSSLKNFLRGQQRFSDYDFDGSGLSILLDVLAYNTHMNALYLNLATNEAFLDSASKRDSVISKAKELGYVPASIRSARATVNTTVTGSNEPVLILPKYSKFTTEVDSQSFNFYTLDAYTANIYLGNHTFEGVEVVEGTLLDFSFTADGVNTAFTIPNANVDLSTLEVIVQEEPEASTYDRFERSDTVMDIDGNSLVYFVKEVAGGKHQIEFGNGVLGKALVAGNVVTVTYIVSSGEAANTARSFRLLDIPATADSELRTITTRAASGGAAAENIEDIKWNAPRAFVAQNRCVTVEDFKTVVNSTYPNASSINVWGGERNDPPAYGKVFISIKPVDSERLSETEKNYLLDNIIKPRCTLTIHPVIVDPDYLYVDLTVGFYYNKRETTKTPGQLKEIVRTAINTYNDNTLAKFGGILKSSVLGRVIDGSDVAIKSSVTTMILRYNLKPLFNKTASYVIELGNPIYNSGVAEQSVTSTGLSVLNTDRGTVYFEDRPRGAGHTVGDLVLYYKVQSRKEYLPGTYGTVNYDTGKITIDSLTITGIVGSELKFLIKPQSDDVAAAKNRIVTISMASNAITAVEDKNADEYIFTSGRN